MATTSTNQRLQTNPWPTGMNSLSLKSLYLELFFKNSDEKFLAHGTAFLIHVKECKLEVRLKFLTAGHNLTGKDFFTKTNLSKSCAIPNLAKIWLPKSQAIGWCSFDIALGCINSPKFKIVQAKGADCDLAVFELTLCKVTASKFLLFCPDPRSFSRHPFKQSSDWMIDSVGAQLLICGFPQKRVVQKLALTIPAVVASEPRNDYEILDSLGALNCHPFFLVSARTWKGQSGSPVYRSASHGEGATTYDWALAAGATSEVVGIYTGRLNPDTHQDPERRDLSDLGIVWPLNLLCTEV
jgi:hypothetical protein